MGMTSRTGGRGRRRAPYAAGAPALAIALEPRYMFDAAGAATAADAVREATAAESAATADAEPTDPASPDPALQQAAAEHTPPADADATSDGAADSGDASDDAAVPLAAAPEPPRKDVAFIDTSVADWQVLRDSVAPGTEVVLIEQGTDGLAQMAAWAEGRQDYDAIHVLSHGGAGYVRLGATTLDAATAEARAGELAAVGAALGVDGDLMLYGCSVGQGVGGAAFVEAVSRITGADVAASDDVTGSVFKGGDWTLETQTGDIEAVGVTAAGYDRVLVTAANLTTFAGGSNQYQEYTAAGYTEPTTINVSNIAGTGWDVSVTSYDNEKLLAIRALNLTGWGVDDKNSLRIYGVHSVVDFKATADSFTFDLSNFKVRVLTATTMYVQALDADGNPKGAAVETDLPGPGVFYSATSMVGNPDFQDIYGFRVSFSETATEVGPAFDNIEINGVAAPNAAPTGADKTVAVAEDGTYTFGAADFGYSDAEAAAMASVRIETAPAGGTLWVDADGNGLANEAPLTAGSVVSRTDIDAGRLKYAPAADDTTTRSFSFKVNDGQSDSASAYTMTLAVTAENDAPVNSVPGDQTTVENTPHLFSNATGNRLSVSDADTGATLTTTLSVPSGSLQVTTGGGATIDHNGTGTVTIQGTAAEINAALAGVTFLPANDYSGTLQLTLTTDDGTVTDTDTVAITVTAANRVPLAGGAVTVTAPDGSVAVVREDSAPTAANIRLSPPTLSDPNGGTPTQIRIISVTGGTLQLADGSTFTLGAGGTALTLVAGGLDLRFTPDGNRDTPGSIVYAVVDPDDATSNGPNSTAVVPIVPVVETPTVTTATTAEDTLSSGGLVVTPGAGDTVPASHFKITGITGGTLYLQDGVTVVGEGSFVTAAQAALGFRFKPTADATSSGSFQVQASSAANDAGLGGVPVTATVAVIAVNDDPTVTGLPDTLTMPEETPQTLDLTGMVLADVDGDSVVRLTLETQSGILTGTGTAGVAVSGSGSETLTLTGRVSDLNAFLAAGITYTGMADLSGHAVDQVVVTVNDQGNTGAGGGGDVLLGIINIDISNGNDLPSGTGLPSDVAVTEDVTSPVDLSGLTLADADPADILTLTLTASAGTLDATVTAGVTLVSGAGTGTLVVRGSASALNAFLDGAGSLTYRGAADAAGDDAATLSVTVADDNGSGTIPLGTVNLDIAAVNDAPTITAPAGLTVTEDVDSVLKHITFSDVDADTGMVTVTITVPKGGLAATSTAGVTVGGTAQALTLTGTIADIHGFLQGDRLTYRTAADDTGATTLGVSIDDGGNGGSGGAKTASTVVPLTVTPVNDAPTVDAAITDRTATRGQAFTATVPANAFADVDGDTLTWSATLADGSALPAWLSFDPVSRTFSGTPAAAGTLTLKVTATDPDGASASQTFTLTVAAGNSAPTVGAVIPAQAATEGSGFVYHVPPGAFADADGVATLTYTATLADGSALPVWLSFNPATRTFTGTPLAAGALALKVTATDPDGASASQTFTLTVADANHAPTVGTAIPAQAATEGSGFVYRVPAGAFADADGAAGLTYTATLTDGSALPVWLSFNSASRTFTGTPIAAGSLALKVTVTDPHGASTSQTFTLTIAEAVQAPAPQTPVPATPPTTAGGPVQPADAPPAAPMPGGNRTSLFGAAAPSLGGNPFGNAVAPGGAPMPGGEAPGRTPTGPADGGTPVRDANGGGQPSEQRDQGVRSAVTGQLGSLSPLANSGTPINAGVDSFDSFTRRSMPGDGGETQRARPQATPGGLRGMPGGDTVPRGVANTRSFGGDALAGALEDVGGPYLEAGSGTPEDELPLAVAPAFTGSVIEEHARFDAEVQVLMQAVAAMERAMAQAAA